MERTSRGRRGTVLVTGASSGIGAEFARLFARNGYQLVVVARNAPGLEALAVEIRETTGVGCTVLCKDLSLPAAPHEIYNELKDSGVQVDVLVNNAGFGFHGPFTDTDLDRDVQMIQVNLVALTCLTKLFARGMVERRSGRILNVGSTASFSPTPLVAVYAATKAYVLSFSEALAEELRGTGVTVTALCPGPTQTQFADRAQMTGTKIFGGRVMSPRDVALIGYRALMGSKTVVVAGVANKLSVFSQRFAPRSLVRTIAKSMLTKHQ